MLSATALEIHNILSRHPRGISRKEICALTGMPQQECLSGLQELSDECDVKTWRDTTDNTAMYRLSESDTTFGDLDGIVLQTIVIHSTRMQSKTIAKTVQMQQNAVNDVLTRLLANDWINYRIPGTYFITAEGLKHIRANYPTMRLPSNIDVRAAHEDQLQTTRFQLGVFALQVPAHYRPRPELQNPVDTINLIHGLTAGLPKRNQQQLQELAEYLMYHNASAKGGQTNAV